MNIRSILILLATLSSFPLVAQLSKEHYIPPFYAHNEGTVTAQEQTIYITTPFEQANYTLTNGLGTVLQSGTVLKGSFARYDMNGYGTAFIADENELNVVLKSKGIIVNSDSGIYVNLRINAGNSFPQGGSLTSKGIDALGTTYRLGHIPSVKSHGRKCSGYSLMATEDGTTVVINFETPDMTFRGSSPPTSNTPLILNLDKGDCYVAAIHSEDDVDNLNAGLIGTLITSSKPIAVNTGSWAGSLRFNDGADVGIDQIVDVSLVGQKYVMVRGQGQGTNDDDMEQVMIVAHEDQTIIFANDSTTAIDTINAGAYRLLDGSFYRGQVMYVETTKPVFVYQFILGGDNTSNTQGMNFVPPITCYTSQDINNIPVIEEIGTRTYQGGVTVVTKKGSTVLINGAPPSVAAEEAVGSDFEAYKIEGLTGNVAVSTNSIALVGFFGYAGAAGYGGFYSGFDQVEFTSSVIEDCLPGVLRSTSNLNGTYQWHQNGNPLAGETNDTLICNEPGDYYVVFTKEECKDTSGIIEILPTPSVDMGENFSLCIGNDTLLQLYADPGVQVLWFSKDSTADLTIDSAGTYWVELINSNSCNSFDSLEVSYVDCTLELAFPTVFSPSSTLNDRFAPIAMTNVLNPEMEIYNRWGIKVATIHELSKGWDGTNDGLAVPTGTYFWVIKFQSQRLGEVSFHQQNGFVMLL